MSRVEEKAKIATLILAAGESKRMGEIKQLLPWKNKNLLEHAISQSLESASDHVFVVLGAQLKAILEATDTAAVTVVHNEKWQLGMGTSIAAAMTFLRDRKLNFDAVLIRLIDQPLLDIDYYNKLIYSYIETRMLIATSYDDLPGVPAVFDKQYFSKLAELSSDKGAKELLKSNTHDLLLVDSKGSNLDMDTQDVYRSYFRRHGK